MRTYVTVFESVCAERMQYLPHFIAVRKAFITPRSYFFSPFFVSIRIGCGMMVLFCFLLPNLQSGDHEVENVIVSTANTVRSMGTFSLRGSAMKSHTYAPEIVHHGVRAAMFGLPHDSPMALLMPSLYLAGAGELWPH